MGLQVKFAPAAKPEGARPGFPPAHNSSSFNAIDTDASKRSLFCTQYAPGVGTDICGAWLLVLELPTGVFEPMHGGVGGGGCTRSEKWAEVCCGLEGGMRGVLSSQIPGPNP